MSHFSRPCETVVWNIDDLKQCPVLNMIWNIVLFSTWSETLSYAITWPEILSCSQHDLWHCPMLQHNLKYCPVLNMIWDTVLCYNMTWTIVLFSTWSETLSYATWPEILSCSQHDLWHCPMLQHDLKYCPVLNIIWDIVLCELSYATAWPVTLSYATAWPKTLSYATTWPET